MLLVYSTWLHSWILYIDIYLYTYNHVHTWRICMHLYIIQYSSAHYIEEEVRTHCMVCEWNRLRRQFRAGWECRHRTRRLITWPIRSISWHRFWRLTEWRRWTTTQISHSALWCMKCCKHTCIIIGLNSGNCDRGVAQSSRRLPMTASAEGCLRRRMTSPMTASTDDCLRRWMPPPMTASTDDCLRRWMPMPMTASADGCLRRWMHASAAPPMAASIPMAAYVAVLSMHLCHRRGLACRRSTDDGPPGCGCFPECVSVRRLECVRDVNYDLRFVNWDGLKATDCYRMAIPCKINKLCVRVVHAVTRCHVLSHVVTCCLVSSHVVTYCLFPPRFVIF